MRLAVPLKRRPVLWLLVPSIPLLLIVAGQSNTSAPEPGYWTWTVAHTALLSIVPAGLAATGAALEASRLRSASSSNVLNLRHPAAVVLDSVWPSYACGLLVQVIAVAVTAVEAPGGNSRFPFDILAAIFALLLFHVAMGFMFGSLLRPTVSIPLALVFSYSWLGFTGTISWAPLRHLSGLVIETCCALDEQVSEASLLAVAGFSLLGALGAFIVGAGALRLTAVPLSAAALAGAAAVASALCVGLAAAWNLGYEATAPRAASQLQCVTGDVEVCLYPEQLAGADVRREVQDMLHRVKDAGVPAPVRAVAGVGNSTRTRLLFRYQPGMTMDELATSLASSFQGETELRCNESPARTTARAETADLVRSWLRSTMLPDTAPRDDVDPFGADPNALRSLRQTAPAAQAQWVKNGIAAMTACGIDPEPRP